LKTVNIPPSYIYGVILKSTTYIIVCVLLFGFSSAANKSITELGKVQIEDLFSNSKSTLILADSENFEFQEFNKNLMNNEDFELESLEISDIDISTFGEYENFLNKYYDENFIDINSRFIKQLEFIFSTSFGNRIPFGANAKVAFDSGLDFGLTLSPNSTFKIFNKDSRLYGNLNTTLITPIDKRHEKYQIIRLTGGITSYINKNIFISSGVSIISSKGGYVDGHLIPARHIENPTSTFGSSINFDLGYKFNIIKQINIGLYLRAQSMISGTLNPPINGGGTLETLSFGLIFESPVYLVY